jgi:hypothetical protein
MIARVTQQSGRSDSRAWSSSFVSDIGEKVPYLIYTILQPIPYHCGSAGDVSETCGAMWLRRWCMETNVFKPTTCNMFRSKIARVNFTYSDISKNKSAPQGFTSAPQYSISKTKSVPGHFASAPG